MIRTEWFAEYVGSDWNIGMPIYVSDLNDTFDEFFNIGSWLQ